MRNCFLLIPRNYSLMPSFLQSCSAAMIRLDYRPRSPHLLISKYHTLTGPPLTDSRQVKAASIKTCSLCKDHPSELSVQVADKSAALGWGWGGGVEQYRKGKLNKKIVNLNKRHTHTGSPSVFVKWVHSCGLTHKKTPSRLSDPIKGTNWLACPTAQAAVLQPVGSHVTLHIQS